MGISIVKIRWSFDCLIFIMEISIPVIGIILYMHPANERRSYNVTSSLIGWVHTWNDPCCKDNLYTETGPRSQQWDILYWDRIFTLKCLQQRSSSVADMWTMDSSTQRPPRMNRKLLLNSIMTDSKFCINLENKNLINLKYMSTCVKNSLQLMRLGHIGDTEMCKTLSLACFR